MRVQGSWLIASHNSTNSITSNLRSVPSTLAIYNQDADTITALHSTLIPHRLYQQIPQYFIKQGQTADIGCGIGRDSFYLQQQGYIVTGVDASVTMLAQTYYQIGLNYQS